MFGSKTRWYAWMLPIVLCCPCPGFSQSSSDFETDIAPLLIRRCVECHQGDEPAGGLSLTSRDEALAGGDSGLAINPSDPEAGELMARIVAGEMPPALKGRSQRLPDDEIATIREWIRGGAVWPEHRVLDYFERTNDVRGGRDWWSLQPVKRPSIPRLKHGPQPKHPIDSFIGAKLESLGIKPAPRADRRTRIRRLYYDLIGIPPSVNQIEDFVSDPDPQAWPKLIDRLLASPQYGERWGRFWLDLARYADTSGYERDQEKPFAWKYRDWVVNAFNEDMPYDQFIMQQIAGDEIPNRTGRSVIATGFLRLGTWNDEPNDAQDYQYERLEDLVHTTSSAFLALTVKCARCHNHKFDAITQEDYYRMASAFWAGPLLTGTQHLGGPSPEQLGVSDVLGWTDTGRIPKPLYVLKNGERHQRLNEVVPASISTLPSLEQTFVAPPPDSKTSQRRLQLAKWIAHPEHPLTSRVMVNRIWQQHFGKGIVRTPNNFGFLSDEPTHPELLDWLASEFDRRGRRMKTLHRLILTSETWQQSAIHPEAAKLDRMDAANRLWWRSERRRLDAETLRDSLLAVSGELDLTVGGPGFKATINPDALEGLSRKDSVWQPSPPEMQTRRSLYQYLKRGLLPPMMTTFDLCDPTLSCGKRDVTIVPTQALALMNNQFVHDRSMHLAESIRKSSGSLGQQARSAWRSILKREPSEKELDRSVALLRSQQEEFARVIDTASDSQPERHDESSLADESGSGGLVLHLRASDAMTSADASTRIEFIPDRSGQQHHAEQKDVDARPTLVRDGFLGKPLISFNGERQFLHLAGELLDSQECTIICVANDEKGSGHRAVISNWNGQAGNSTTSLFLGLTSESTVRFSDAFGSAGRVSRPAIPFVLSAVNGLASASVFQNGRMLKSTRALPKRRLDTGWVIGQQGNIDGEFWKGGIAEILVYNQALPDRQRKSIESRLANRYGVSLSSEKRPAELPDETTLALASLCHVLLNSNEFIFLD